MQINSHPSSILEMKRIFHVEFNLYLHFELDTIINNKKYIILFHENSKDYFVSSSKIILRFFDK